ncbi:hypothetical protein [Microbulbifer discodermiae]
MRWLNGSGETLITNGGSWGEYMKANQFLTNQINLALYGDAANRLGSGFVNLTVHGEIQNGYSTGYEMLHGTHRGLGDLSIIGFAELLSTGGYAYNVTVTWNDRIDPNPIYLGDRVRAGILNTIFSPADYDVHISWQHSRDTRYTGGN